MTQNSVSHLKCSEHLIHSVVPSGIKRIIYNVYRYLGFKVIYYQFLLQFTLIIQY